MKGVNVRETRLLEQAIAKNSFRYLTLEEHAIVDKAYKALKESELYLAVWKDIEAKANELVNTKCRPEWDRISEEMKPLGEERNKLAEENSKEEDEEKKAKIEEIDKQLAELSNEYQKVTDNANAELNEFKEKRISEEEGACFFLEDDEYQLVWELVWFALPINQQ